MPVGIPFGPREIAEALETEDSSIGAIAEAAGFVPLLRARLRDNEVVNAQVILAPGNMIEERWASEW
jgi:hypothetical protein